MHSALSIRGELSFFEQNSSAPVGQIILAQDPQPLQRPSSIFNLYREKRATRDRMAPKGQM
jgi:hypothetical protein